MVVVETTWLLRNLVKLRTETRTVNMVSVSAGGSSGSSCEAVSRASRQRVRRTRYDEYRGGCLTHLGIRAVLPFGIDLDAFGVDRDLEAAAVTCSDGKDIGHGPEPFYNRP